MDLKEVMAINLRRLRHAKELTQEDLADLTGLSARYIGAIERGNKSATVTVLGKIADALKTDPAELIRKPEAKARSQSPRSGID
jgi:transcriptional regulator with XRE-family HTH domain